MQSALHSFLYPRNAQPPWIKYIPWFCMLISLIEASLSWTANSGTTFIRGSSVTNRLPPALLLKK